MIYCPKCNSNAALFTQVTLFATVQIKNKKLHTANILLETVDDIEYDPEEEVECLNCNHKCKLCNLPEIDK